MQNILKPDSFIKYSNIKFQNLIRKDDNTFENNIFIQFTYHIFF